MNCPHCGKDTEVLPMTPEQMKKRIDELERQVEAERAKSRKQQSDIWEEYRKRKEAQGWPSFPSRDIWCGVIR